jgi:hypothetical protein
MNWFMFYVNDNRQRKEVVVNLEKDAIAVKYDGMNLKKYIEEQDEEGYVVIKYKGFRVRAEFINGSVNVIVDEYVNDNGVWGYFKQIVNVYFSA